MPERHIVYLWSNPKLSGEYSDRFMTLAKELVVDNYNRHHDSHRTPPLTMADVFIVWFSTTPFQLSNGQETQTIYNWKAVVGSSILRGLLYEVAFDGNAFEAHIEIFKKINSATITVERAR